MARADIFLRDLIGEPYVCRPGRALAARPLLPFSATPLQPACRAGRGETPYGTPEELEEALKLAVPLSAIYQTISCRKIFAQWEEGDHSRWELRVAIPAFLRLVLSEMGHLVGCQVR